MSEWRSTEEGEDLAICNELCVRVFEGAGLWYYQIISTYPECILSQFQTTSEQGAKIAALEAALALAKRIEETALGELRRNKQAAQDADDAALVAAHGEVVWAVRDAGYATLHTATVAGHPCCVEVYTSGGVKWYLEPDCYGHPHTWDAPDLETAKMRAAAAALRQPCKRWRVTLPAQGRGIYRIEGGEVEVWAVTREGALYRAAAALSSKIYCMGIIGEIKGEAVEMAG